MVGVIYGLSESGSRGGFGSVEVLLPLLVGAALIVAFAGWAWRREDRALIDVQLFRHSPLRASAALLFTSSTALYGAMLLPLYWQLVRGADALAASLLLIPQGVGALASRTLAGRLTDAIGGRWVAVAGFAVAAGTIPFAFATATTPTWFLLATLLIRGFGTGCRRHPADERCLPGTGSPGDAGRGHLSAGPRSRSTAPSGSPLWRRS